MFVLLTQQALPECDRLAAAEQDLQQLTRDVCEKWHTQEDLEDLLAATYPLPTEKLEALSRAFDRSAWYASRPR